MTRLRLPTTTVVWAVQHITTHGPVTDYHDTEQAARNQYTHLTGSRIAAIYYASSIITDPAEAERNAA